ncbi:unnamed protein product [Cladocopium goreaui]|uniref:Nucleolar protein 16 n=1 Tax=Cladocopium goreaui TaxID=2562237 RepID=A0A9P1G2G3_9DINO|nr:unnamed protein product [Cladocopium goreaui]
MLVTRGRGRFSSHVLKECILTFYEHHRLWPTGIVRAMACVDAWSLKSGLALQRLAPWDLSWKHPDDIDDESQEEDAVAASDTLSELSAPASSSNLVTPQCKGDQRLKNIKLQMADWDSLQTPVKQRENHVKSLAEELKKAMDEAKGNSVKESALVPGQLPDHVLKVMEAQAASLPKPFPQSAQYKNSIEDADDGERDTPNEKPTKKLHKRKKNAKKRPPAQIKHAAKDPKQDEHPTDTEIKPAAEDETYSPTRYAELRKKFIDAKRSGGMTWQDANAEWNSSDLKRRLLSCVELSELKRRRFVPKECEANPWAS